MNLGRISVRRLRLSLLSAIAVAAPLAGGSATSAQVRQADRPQAHRVEVREFGFSPAKLRIEPGERIVFLNRDPVPHDATQSGVFATGPLRRGDARAVRFMRRGVYRYLCTFHTYMHGKVVVRPEG